MVVVTAADRAAATLQRWGTNPSARLWRAPPLSGEALRKGARRLPPQRKLSAVRLTEDKPFCWEVHCRGGGVYLPPFAPRMVPLLLRKEARGGGFAAISYCFVPFRHDQRALRSPFGNLRPITPQTMWNPTLAGRGGSVSRRDHNLAYRRCAQLTGGTNSEETF